MLRDHVVTIKRSYGPLTVTLLKCNCNCDLSIYCYCDCDVSCYCCYCHCKFILRGKVIFETRGHWWLLEKKAPL